MTVGTTLVRSNRSQAVRLPKDVSFPAPVVAGRTQWSGGGVARPFLPSGGGTTARDGAGSQDALAKRASGPAKAGS